MFASRLPFDPKPNFPANEMGNVSAVFSINVKTFLAEQRECLSNQVRDLDLSFSGALLRCGGHLWRGMNQMVATDSFCRRNCSGPRSISNRTPEKPSGAWPLAMPSGLSEARRHCRQQIGWPRATPTQRNSAPHGFAEHRCVRSFQGGSVFRMQSGPEPANKLEPRKEESTRAPPEGPTASRD